MVSIIILFSWPWRNKEENYSDDEIVEGLKNDNPAIFEFLDRKFRHKVITFVGNKGSINSKMDGDDLYNICLYEVIIQIKRGSYNPNYKFAGFFYRVYSRKWYRLLRKRNINIEVTEQFPDEDSSNQYEFLEELGIKAKYLELVKEYLYKIREECTELLNLFYYQNLNATQVASLLGKTATTIRQNKRRCLQKIKDAIQADSRWHQL